MAKKKQPRLPTDGSASTASRAAKAARREEAARLVREQQRGERRRTILIQVGVAVVVVAIVLGTTVALLAGRDDGGSGATPSGLTADGTVRFGADDAPVVLQVVEDFQCPACRQFEAAAGDLLAGYHDSEEVAVEYRPIAFLDRASTTDYSSRALNASMCVLEDAGQDTWLDYHQALFADQPAEGGAGLPDEQLAALATGVGASEEVSGCIEDRTWDDWVGEQTDTVLDEGVSSTPTLLVNGEQLEASDPDSIRAAVEAAGAGS